MFKSNDESTPERLRECPGCHLWFFLFLFDFSCGDEKWGTDKTTSLSYKAVSGS